MINFGVIIFSKEHYPLNGQSLGTANSVNPSNLHKTDYISQSISFMVQCLQHRAAGRAPDDSWPMDWLVGSLITPCSCCQLSSMAAPQEIMIFLWHAAKPAPDFWSSQHQCKHKADESPWLLLPRMSPKLVQPVGQRLREQKAWPKHHHWASHLPQLGKKEVIQKQKMSSGSCSCRGTPRHSTDVCWDWALSIMQRYTCKEVQEVRVTLEGIWGNLLTQWTSFMDSKAGKEQQITLSDLLCDRPGTAFRS